MRYPRANNSIGATLIGYASLAVVVIAGLCALAQPAGMPEPDIRRGEPARDEHDEPAGRRTFYYDRLARKAEPDGRGAAARLPQYLELFRREVVKDTRLFAFDVRARAAGHAAVLLEGFVEFPEQRESLVSFLRALGFGEIDDRIATSPGIAARAEAFALVMSPRTFLYDRTTAPRERLSECTIGEGLHLLNEEREGHLLCHAADGYVGYVQADHVLRVGQERFDEYRKGERAVILRDIARGEVRIPIGSSLKATADGVVLPDGTKVIVDANALRRVTPDPRIEKIVQTALDMAGTKYLWGGRTADGIDCSGLVQLAFRSQGVHLPRDSDQQAHVGALVATRWHRTGVRRGDTLFFMGRHGTINHTAIYLGDGKYVEAAGPDVRISSFDPADKAFAERNARAFCFARRVLE